ncbi:MULTISPECIES: hypothetical protein [Mesorhizobium]|uniref:hypothetical protein n=1 Tax=Mesorhizobium TaxID=68287 RepID=UPI0012EC5AB6|nr:MULTISPECIES: hypothetical protein [Mesorhizobium]WJI41469.1 hypothetical protein NL534_14980 [Mesorhizobium opportunistum]
MIGQGVSRRGFTMGMINQMATGWRCPSRGRNCVAGCASKSPPKPTKYTLTMAGSLCASMASGASHDADLIMNALRKPN